MKTITGLRKHLLVILLLNLVVFCSIEEIWSQAKTDREFRPPEVILNFAGVEPGMIIGEVGVGDGFLTFPLAERVGKTGKIYANDINENYLEDFKYFLEQKDLGNIEIVIGETEDPLFPEDDLDMIIMADVFHDLEKPISLIENTRKYLKSDGKLVISERDNTKYYDHPSYYPHFKTKEQLLYIMAKSSFDLIKVDTSLERDNLYIFKISKRKKKDVWNKWMKEFQLKMDKTMEYEKEVSFSNVNKRINWQRLLDEFKDNNPKTDEDEEWRAFIHERIDFLNESIKSQNKSRIERTQRPVEPNTKIRVDYISLDHDDLSKIFRKLGFVFSRIIKSGEFDNLYKLKIFKGNTVIIDETTHLMWHQNGSQELFDFFDAQIWIDELNKNDYAGFSDWRLPNVEEVISIMEKDKQINKLHIDPIFSKTQNFFWTGDTYYSGLAWMAYFNTGSFTEALLINRCYVRPVRSIQ